MRRRTYKSAHTARFEYVEREAQITHKIVGYGYAYALSVIVHMRTIHKYAHTEKADA